MSHMKSIFFVQPNEADIARRMEKILLGLPEESGVLFAGVTVVSDTKSRSRKVLYQVTVGCDRSRDTELIDLLVRKYLRQEVADDAQLVIRSYRGIDRNSVSS